MKPKIKDGVKLNLYVDKDIVRRLGALAAERRISRSQYVEQMVRACAEPDKISGGGTKAERRKGRGGK